MYECTKCGHKKGALSSMAAYDFRRWRTHGSEESPIEVLGREDICSVCRCLSFFAMIDDYELEPLQEQQQQQQQESVSPGTLDADAVADATDDTAMDTREEMMDALETEPTPTHLKSLKSEVGRCLGPAIDSDTDSEDSDDALGERIVRCCRNYQMGTITEAELPRGLTFADFRHLHCGPGPSPIGNIELGDDNGPETSAQAMRRNPGRFQLHASHGYLSENHLQPEAKKETLMDKHSSFQCGLEELDERPGGSFAALFDSEHSVEIERQVKHAIASQLQDVPHHSK